MIIYGSRASHLKTERVSGIKCDHCHQQAPHNISVFGRYAHVYWIPFFPAGKKAVSECTHCKATLEKKEMNQQLRLAHDNVKRSTKTPIWNWAGIALLAVLIGSIYFSVKKHEKDVVNFIAAPKRGDIVEFVSETNYSTFKIDKVSKDSIYIIRNNYETDMKSGISDIDKAENYTEIPFAISRSSFEKSFKDKTFYDINR